MLLRELLEIADLRLILLIGDEEHLERSLHWTFTTDLLDPGRYLSGGELVLSGLVWRRRPEDSAEFVAALADREVAALAAGDAAFGTIPGDLVDACHSSGLPLVEVPVDVSFSAVSEAVTRRLTREREGDPAAVLGQRRRLSAALAQGEGLDGLLSVWHQEVAASCWVLTPTGRTVAGTSPEPASTAPLARAYLRADSVPCVVRGDAAAVYTLHPLPSSPVHRLESWFLVCEGDHHMWSVELRDLTIELASLIGFERTRLDERRRARWMVNEQLLRPVLSGGADPASVAEDVRASGVDLDGAYAAVSLEIFGRADPGELACPVLEELLDSLRAVSVVASVGEDAVALVGLAGPLEDLVAGLRDLAGRLEHGLNRGRLLVGLGAPTRGPGGLREAVQEARLARGLADVRDGRSSLLTCDEIDSHALLLATVPEEVRAMFRTRLLGPVLEYDAAHGTELLGTLREFLACSGSWSRCSQQLHVHVNTLRYRIRRIEELTGRSLATLEDRVDFFLALGAARDAHPGGR